jgi:hypothetical protein
MSEPIAETQPTPKQTREIRPCRTEPVFGLIPNDTKYKNMEAAWKQFVASGQYRLACDSDGDLSEIAKYPEGYTRSWYMFNYGNWNYPKRDYEDHLAAIVVDTTRNDASRFSLVIFSPPRREKNNYEINWLYRERDLSRASVGMSSGSVWVDDDLSVKKEKVCSIRWNRIEKIFECI